MTRIKEGWEAVIGLEVHAQLKTRSKLFSSCPVAGGSTADLSPNTFVDAITAALPGTLPVPNGEAIRLATRLGLALGCTIDRRSQFARKHYFYPDSPKGYQISQYDRPICAGGGLAIASKFVRLTRIHLEEDAGKTIHDARRPESRVDLNRAGVALVEIVSEPDLASSDEAVAYLKELHRLVVWLGVSDGNMEEGNFRCDANVSVRRVGDPKLGTRTEIKNVNSFRFVGLAIDAEIVRQINVLDGGGAIVQETRGWDEASGTTRSLRSKEDAHDYRYFPDPDLLVLDVSDAVYDGERTTLPELPAARERRYREALGLTAYDAEVLTQTRLRSDWFEALLSHVDDPKTAANWIVNDLLGALAKRGQDLSAPDDARGPLAPATLGALLAGLKGGALSSRMVKDGLAAALAHGPGFDVAAWIGQHGGQVSDSAALIAAIDPILAANASQVAEYLSGKDKVFGFFVGQAMKAMKGKAAPEELQRVLRERLDGLREKG
ncbi:MAG: Asp-tRNA(Asn)/Glu-tRNA(Gln) amidotransferase subunit GatB [Deltaproteobacteria bacterium]|nr:Asp-tRNA(Asn)/Glu-tRNA(Gln) amidotransferase subunit GatB [Deltaproteobacteria bacterium]